MLALTGLFGLLLVAEAVQQGICVWIFRELVPAEYMGVSLKKYIHVALHILGVASYLVVAAWVAYPLGLLLNVPFWAVVVLLRVVCFDVTLNLTRNYLNRVFGRGWEPLFSVGTSSLTDWVVQWIAARLGANPTVVSGLLRVAALAGVVALLLV